MDDVVKSILHHPANKYPSKAAWLDTLTKYEKEQISCK
jgi:hypothetical protein